MMRNQSQIYIVGAGIAGLSAAVFAIRDGGIKGENIHLFEERDVLGGALDAKSDHEQELLDAWGKAHQRKGLQLLLRHALGNPLSC